MENSLLEQKLNEVYLYLKRILGDSDVIFEQEQFYVKSKNLYIELGTEVNIATDSKNRIVFQNIAQLVRYFTNNFEYDGRNKIKQVQDREIHKQELKYLESDENVLRLFENREKHLDSHKKWYELTTAEILNGVKISKHIGYSNFNYKKQCLEWFAKYKPKVIYDCFGGWGDRYMFFSPFCKYIYNDINTDACENLRKMGCQNVYNECSTKFVPDEDYDAIFTCPPYFDYETYTEQGMENLDKDDFIEAWNKICENCFLNKKSCKIFAFVINAKNKFLFCEKLIKECCVYKEIILGGRENHFFRKYNIKRNVESIITFNKKTFSKS